MTDQQLLSNPELHYANTQYNRNIGDRVTSPPLDSTNKGNSTLGKRASASNSLSLLLNFGNGD